MAWSGKRWPVWGARGLLVVAAALVVLPLAFDALGPTVRVPPGRLRMNGLEVIGLLAVMVLTPLLAWVVLPIGPERLSRANGDVLSVPTVLGERDIRLGCLVRVRGLMLVPVLATGPLSTFLFLELRDAEGGKVILSARAQDSFTDAVVDAVAASARSFPARVSPTALGLLQGSNASGVWVAAKSLLVIVIAAAVCLAGVILYLICLSWAQT